MKFATWINILALAVLTRPAIAAEQAASDPAADSRTDAAVTLGVTMAYPGYTFTKLPEAYPKTAWPKVADLVDVARTPAFTKLFADDHFNAYILVELKDQR